MGSIASGLNIGAVEPKLGFIQRSGQSIPNNAHTTVVRYRTSPGDLGSVIDACRDLFNYTEQAEMDVYSLAIMNIVESEDEFIILERNESMEAEQRHLDSAKCVARLKEIKGMIVMIVGIIKFLMSNLRENLAKPLDDHSKYSSEGVNTVGKGDVNRIS